MLSLQDMLLNLEFELIQWELKALSDYRFNIHYPDLVNKILWEMRTFPVIMEWSRHPVHHLPSFPTRVPFSLMFPGILKALERAARIDGWIDGIQLRSLYRPRYLSAYSGHIQTNNDRNECILHQSKPSRRVISLCPRGSWCYKMDGLVHPTGKDNWLITDNIDLKVVHFPYENTT